MSEETISMDIHNLAQLDQAARKAADQLNKANAQNAILDKALKALKPALANLSDVRAAAKSEAEQAKKLVKDLEGSYDDSASKSIREDRTSVDSRLEFLKQELSTAAGELDDAKGKATKAQTALDTSAADFAKAQEQLMGMPKQIQDQQKALMALEAATKDAHGKHQVVDAVINFDELNIKIEDFNELIDPKREADLWTTLNNAATELLNKTSELPEIQAKVAPLEVAYNEAKARYDEAQKTRLDDIKTKQRLADEEKTTTKRTGAK